MHTSGAASIKAQSVLAAVLCVVVAMPARAQQASSAPASQEDINKQLLDRLHELEKQVQQLQAQTLAPAPVPEPVPVMEAPRVENRLNMHVFGDVGYAATDKKGISNTFRVGSLDLFMTERLSERVSLLGELLFISSKDNTILPDVERLLLQYKHDDHFNFGIGRYHTSIGYYNTAFHQGSWFETAIDRPFMYAFDDAEGFLPLQEVGVTTYGQIPSGKLGLNYVFEVGNGRNHLLGGEPAQNSQDCSNGKSVNVALFARPSWVPGLQFGFSVYHDYLTYSDNINHSELISTVHVVYADSKYEFLNEGMLVRHGNAGPPTASAYTPAFYTQFSRRFGSYRPYFRY